MSDHNLIILAICLFIDWAMFKGFFTKMVIGLGLLGGLLIFIQGVIR